MASASAAHCLSAILLNDLYTDDKGTRSWIMLLPEGEYEHPKGTLKLNRKMLSEVKSNFDQRVRGVDIALDYDHKASDGDSKAFGWIEEIKFFEPGAAPLRNQPKGSYPPGLWALVRWTSIGLDAVRDQIYRYISAEYRPEWTNPVNKKTYHNVLVGATLTNRPFMNQMPAVQLSDEERAVTRYAALYERDAGGGVQMSSVRNVHLNKLLAGIGEDEDEDLELDDDEESEEYAEDLSEDLAGIYDAEEDEGDEGDEDESGEFPAASRSRNSGQGRDSGQRRPARKATVQAGASSGSREMSEQDKEQTVSLAEAQKMQETIRDLSLRLFESKVDEKIKLWETPATDGAGRTVTTKAFNDEYRAFMLSEGFALSEGARAAIDSLIEKALNGTVELGQRSLAAADMESRQTRSAGQGDDRQVVERIEAIALEEYGKPWKALQKDAKSDEDKAALREIVRRAWRETGYDPIKLSASIAQGATRLRD